MCIFPYVIMIPPTSSRLYPPSPPPSGSCVSSTRCLVLKRAREVCSKTCANKQLITWHDIWNRCFKKTAYKLYTCNSVYIYVDIYIIIYTYMCSILHCLFHNPHENQGVFCPNWFFLCQWWPGIQGCGWNWGILISDATKNKVPGWIWNGLFGKHQEEVERQSWRIS